MGTPTHSKRNLPRVAADATVSPAGVVSDSPAASPTSVSELVSELRVHQIELEAQNDELLRIQAELTESRDLYCDLFDTAPVGYLTLEPGGKIVAANSMSSVLLKHERDELIGQQLQSFFSPQEADQLHRLFRDVLAGKDHQACDLSISESGDNVTNLHVQCTLGVKVGERDASIRMTLSDVTSLKQAEAERTELERRLQQEHRLAGLGVLAGGVAHDFNNLLFGIMAHADLLTLDEATPSQQSSVQQIRAAATQSADLCSQLLDFAGKRQLAKSVFRLSDAVDGISDLLLPTLNAKQIQFNCMHASDLPLVEGDVTRIRQVVMNVVLNAAEAIDDVGGTVEVATGCVRVGSDDDDQLGMQFQDDLRSGEYVFLTVVDSGCGIEPESLKKVFEPFFTTKFTGRGLGLASVLGIVRSHEGAMKIESVPGEGTAVHILLPVTSKPLHDKALFDHPGAQGQSTVLLVDDEELIRFAVQAKLQRQGHFVIVAADGEEALSLLEKHIGQIDIVVLDLTMPGLSTAAICTSIHRMVPQLPVLLMSGYSEEEALNRCEYKNVAGFVPKPLGDVANAISQILQSSA